MLRGGMFIRYPDAFICRVTGKHALQYLQNRLTNDLRSLGEGGLPAAALTPQGKIEGLFHVIAPEPGTFLLVADGGDHGAIASALTKFRVAERVEFLDESADWRLFHLDRMDAAQIPAPAGSLIINAPRFSDSGKHLLVRREAADSIAQQLADRTVELHGESLLLARVERGVPAFPDELLELLPAEAGLRSAVSYTKGCYVGQEVVAKLDALGKAPRTLVTFHAENAAEIPPDCSVTAEHGSGRPLGKILSWAFNSAADQLAGFAIIKNDPKLLNGPLHGGNILLIDVKPARPL